jgi:hypothetical protein
MTRLYDSHDDVAIISARPDSGYLYDIRMTYFNYAIIGQLCIAKRLGSMLDMLWVK